MGKIEVLCLGTGTTNSFCYENVPCTSYVILADAFPLVLIGAGAGTIQMCLQYVHMIPEVVVVLNSSVDQTAELAPLVDMETQRGRKIKLFAATGVMESVVNTLQAQLSHLPHVCEDRFKLCSVPYCTSSRELVPLIHDFSMILHPCSTSEPFPTSALVLFYRDQCAAAFGGPISFDANLQAKLCSAPFIFEWANASGAAYSSFADITIFAEKVNSTRRNQEERLIFLIGGYGATCDAPMIAGYVTPVQLGTPIVVLAGEFVRTRFTKLNLPLPNVRKAPPLAKILNRNLPPETASSSSNVNVQMQPVHLDPGPYLSTANNREAPTTADNPESGLTVTAINMPPENYPSVEDSHEGLKPSSSGTRKIWAFTNEDKGAPGKLLVLSKFRKLEQLQQHISKVFSTKPIKELVYANGVPVRNFDDIPDGSELIAIKLGGAGYNRNDLPRLIKTVKKK